MNQFNNINKLYLFALALSGTQFIHISGMQKTLPMQVPSREILDKWSPLHIASSKSDITEMKRLLTAGAKINVEDAKGRTPLFIAAELGKTEAVRFLCQEKADVNAKEDEHGMFPLHVASWQGNEDIVGILLTNGAKVNVEEKFGKSPLHVASSREVVKLLIDSKIDVTKKDKKGLTALESAMSNGNRDIVKALLIDVEELSKPGEDGSTILHQAARVGFKPEVMKVLLSFGASVWDKDKKEMIPLHTAAIGGKIEAVESLIALDPKQVHARDKNGETPLHWAAVSGHPMIVDRLIANGAEVDARNKKLMTPLHWATTKGHEAVTTLLVETHKADINAKGALGETPLHRATTTGSLPVIKVLLKNGARVQETDSGGATAVDIALKADNKEIQDILRPSSVGNGKTPTTEKTSSTQIQDPVKIAQSKALAKAVRILEAKKPNKLHEVVRKIPKGFSFVNVIWFTGEDFSYKLDEPKINKVLAENAKKPKFTIDDLDDFGLSVLMYASGGGCICTTRFSSPISVAGGDLFPTFTAIALSLELTKLLLLAGADSNVTNATGITPIMCLVANATTPPCMFHLTSTQYKSLESYKSCNKKSDFPTFFLDLKDNEHVEMLIPVCATNKRSKGNGGGWNFERFLGNLIKQGAIVKNKAMLLETIKLMISKGANIHHADQQAISVLMWACSLHGGDIDIIKTLVELGVDVNALNHSDENALMYAARWGHEEAVRLLLPLTNNINQKSKSGETALLLSGRADRSNFAIFSFLLNAGADIQNIPPSIYLTLSQDARFALDKEVKKGHPLPGNNRSQAPSSADDYARYQTEAYQRQQQENFERMEAGRAAQLAAQQSANTVHAVGTGVSAVTSIIRLTGGM